MSIVATEIESMHGDVSGQRIIFYRCQDSQGVWHRYGPVICNDPAFDATAHMAVVETKVADQLAEQEAAQVIA